MHLHVGIRRQIAEFRPPIRRLSSASSHKVPVQAIQGNFSEHEMEMNSAITAPERTLPACTKPNGKKLRREYKRKPKGAMQKRKLQLEQSTFLGECPQKLVKLKK